MFNKNAYNSSRVLQVVWQEEAISRVAISKIVDLNKSTITKLLTPMIEEGIIVSGEKLASGHQGGRKAEELSINENYGYVLGIEINTTTFYICVTDLKGKVVITNNFEYNNDHYSFQKLIDLGLQKAIKLCAKRDLKILGGTIGVSGLINPYDGIIYRSNPLKVDSPVKLYEKLKEYPFPVLIENDANCCCSTHLVHSAADRKRNFITVLGEFRKPSRESEDNSGIAIGIGLVIRGSIYHGDDFSAGEFQSLDKNVDNASQFNIVPEDVHNIRNNDQLLNKVLRELSRNISLLVNTLNISQVIFEGNIVEAEYMLKPILRDEIQRNWAYDSQVDCHTTFSVSGSGAVALGAACNFLEKLFSPPKFWEEREEYYPSGIELFNYIKN